MAELNPEQWAEIKRLFMEAAELQPEEFSDYLQRECPDYDVRREVASLLDYSGAEIASADAAIASAAADAAQEPDPDERLIGTHLGPYKVEAIVGHGGMGAVYRASRDDAEFRQQVAIKLVRVAAESPDTLRRFRQERQILARLSHPNIARLLDGGSTPEGVPYLVMEFIEGEPITAWCERHSLGLQERLRLFLRVCEAVEFAHRDLVVHRDLKPANILVAKDGTPKLLDFGIAKLLDPGAEHEAATLTRLVMTPEYAAPERVRGEPSSTAADVYSLGLILYELLTGKKAQPMSGYTPDAIASVVCQTEPAAPARLKPQLAGDLDHIIRMAIRKEPERRYASAGLLARDIRLHLEGRPVTARADTAAYRTAKFLRRNRAAVGGGLITAILFGGAVLTYWLAKPGRVPRVLRVAQLTQTGHADLTGGLAADSHYVYFVEKTPGQWTCARVPVEGGTPQPLKSTLTYVQMLHISPDGSQLLLSNGIGEDVPLWAAPTDGGEPRRIGDAAGHTAAWSPDGKQIVFGRESALFTVNSDGSGLRKLLDTPGKPDSVRWAPTALRYAVTVSVDRKTLWEARPDGTHPHLLLPNWDSTANSVYFDDSGDWMAGGKYYLFRAARWEVFGICAVKEGHRFLGFFNPHPVLIHSTPSEFHCATPSPDGKRVFFISGQGRSQFVRYDGKRREFVPFLPGQSGKWASLSKDGRWVAYTSGDPNARLWRSRSDGGEAVLLTPPSMDVYEPHWSPDGAWIVFSASLAGQPFNVYAIPSAGGRPERLPSSDSTTASNYPSWSPDGRSVLFRRDPPHGVSSRGLYLMNWRTKQISFVPQSENWMQGTWSPDAKHIAGTDGSQIQIFDIRTQRWAFLARGKGLGPALWSRSGKYVYYQDQFETEQPIFRASIGGGKIERMMGSRQIPQSDLTRYSMACLGPDDAPIASVRRNNAEIYALELELP